MSMSLGKADATRLFVSQDFDLNLAPIIDCFTVLIAFVMISAAFASVGVIEAGTASGRQVSGVVNQNRYRVLVTLRLDHLIKIQIKGKESLDVSLPKAPDSESFDLNALVRSLERIKNGKIKHASVIIAAENDVEYEWVVKALESSRKVMPEVALGGG
jgi:biopolymer transport protein ExbD